MDISQAEITSIFHRRNVIPSMISIRGVETSVWGSPQFVEMEEKKENPKEKEVL